MINHPLPSSTQQQGPLHIVNDAVSPPPNTEQRNNETFLSEPEDTPSPSSNDDDDDDENDGDVYAHSNAYSADVPGETAAQDDDDDDGYEADGEENNL